MKKYFRKINLKLRKRWERFNSTPDLPLTQIHTSSASIFRVALSDADSKLMLMPISNKRIIKLEKMGLFIKIEKYSISITNKDYNYITELPITLYEKLSEMFDNKLDNFYNNEEIQINNHVEKGIANILKSLTENK